MPTAVAMPRSVSPNQFVASLETGFLRNAYPLTQTICPKKKNQKFPVAMHSALISVPAIMSPVPTTTHDLSPRFSINLVDAKFAGMYSSRSAYLATCRMASDTSYTFITMTRLVLNEPVTIPVAADVRKYESSTSHRCL